MEFQLVLKALRFAVYFIPNEKKISNYRIISLVIRLLPFVSLHILMLMYYFTVKYNVYDAVVCTLFFFYFAVTMFRRFYFLYNRKDISALIKMFHFAPKCKLQEFNRLDIEMRSKSSKRIKRFNFQIFVYSIYAIVTIVIAFVFYRIVATLLFQVAKVPKKAPVRLLIFHVWWFTNPKATPTYYVMILWQSVVVITALVVTRTTDAFTCSLTLVAAERASLLSRTAPSYLMPGARGKVTRRFRTWVRYHQHYLRMVQKLNEVMGPIIWTTYFSELVTLIAMSYIFIKVKDVYFHVLLITTMLGTFIQMFMLAKAGQKLIQSSIKLSRSVLSASQVSRGGLKAGPARSALQVLVTRLSGGAKPEHISAMGFFIVSMEYFTAVLRGSFTYIFFLLQFNGPARV